MFFSVYKSSLKLCVGNVLSLFRFSNFLTSLSALFLRDVLLDINDILETIHQPCKCAIHKMTVVIMEILSL